MQSKEIITAPIVDAITPSGVVDSPSACGAFIFYPMKLIPLTRGKFAMVDDEDYDYLMQWKWFSRSNGFTDYAGRTQRCNGIQIFYSMHRDLMKTPRDLLVDHINGNGLNNQKANLRNCTLAQNMYNRKNNGKSKYHGVSFYYDKKGKQYIRTAARINGVYTYLGTFKTEEDAARAYDAKIKETRGEFANLNFK